MYTLINKNAARIVGEIPRQHVTDYEWLLTHQNEAKPPEYQRNFRKFWAMNAAQLGTDFYTVFFDLLGTVAERKPSLNQVCYSLYECSSRRDGRKSLQFSFATKLLHMGNPWLPIYDSQVADFYFLVAPDSKKTLQQRIGEFVIFHEFLIREYKRILEQGLLQAAIGEFRNKLRPQNFTDEKVVDSLIWKTVDLFKKGALAEERIAYC
jgi:hypothetical protein